MLKYISCVFTGLASALFIRERRRRMSFERLGAATLESLLDAIDANSAETGAHVRRVADYAITLAAAADLDDWTQHSVERVALFHDIGKMDGAIADIVAESTGLSPEEKRAMREHPQKGADVLRPLTAFFPELPEGILAHHERWDGNGYPRGLKGLSIPIEARIVAIADTFDAITHSRSYSLARTFEVATAIIAEGRGTQFDPELTDLFLSPPVLDSVEKMMRRGRSPKRAGRRRPKPSLAVESPDITFRWRTPSRGQPRMNR